VRRRSLLLGFPLLVAAIARGGKDSLRGRLKPQSDGTPALLTAGGKLILVEGDEPTSGVLRDKRLAGADMEVAGSLVEPGRFAIDPIHTRSLFVHKNGKRLFVTYWCEVCAIRTYTPGLCMCCQEETQLDLRESIGP
jgi:hypothetical protein